MCDASDFAIGAVLGKRHEKHFKTIHYASKTMNDAETTYTTTEKEILENLYKNELDPKEINETFPLETISMVTFRGDSSAPWEKFHNALRCLKIPSKFVKSLTFGALTLWARSRLHEGTNIFSWPSTIFQNGLKRKRFPLMTPELFANS
nr:retrovirus-related Pol polyprotein from transposon opus [Tanacetum cinerariifolium]